MKWIAFIATVTAAILVGLCIPYGGLCLANYSNSRYVRNHECSRKWQADATSVVVFGHRHRVNSSTLYHCSNPDTDVIVEGELNQNSQSGQSKEMR